MLARIILVILSVLWVRPVCAQSERKVYPLVHHVMVEGDLCTTRAAREIAARIHDAVGAKADSIVLEFASDAWRPDVVHAIAASIRESPVRVTVWLRDAKDHRVGAGQATLGLIATACWIEPETRVERRDVDDRRELAPKDTEHEKIVNELMRWAGERRGGRTSDALLPRLLLAPPAPMWAIDGRGGEPGLLRITPSLPSAGSDAPARVLPLTRERAGSTLEVVVTPEAAVGLGLASGRASYLADMFETRGVNPRVSRFTVNVRLEPIVERALGSLRALDREIDDVEANLKRKPRDQRVNTGPFYRELGAAGLKDAAGARGRLDACERLLAADPEIARTPPPGTSPTAETDAHAAAWRRAFEKRRSAIERLEKKAKELAGR